MRQIDFLVFIVALIAVALFSMQNAQPAIINLIPGVSLESPLAVELLCAAGFGAIFSWIYTWWRQAESAVETRKKQRSIQQKEQHINELQQMLTELETAVKQLPPSKRADILDADVEATVAEESSSST